MRPTTLPRVKPELPLPWEVYDGTIVVASTWLNDEPGEEQALLLTLASSAPYYRVREISTNNGGDWTNQWFDDFPNIVPAVEAYQENGGDY
jgi:hypothetical protein